jgi:hypothetical protein
VAVVGRLRASAECGRDGSDASMVSTADDGAPSSAIGGIMVASPRMVGRRSGAFSNMAATTERSCSE